jgi:hypothetical protein
MKSPEEIFTDWQNTVESRNNVPDWGTQSGTTQWDPPGFVHSELSVLHSGVPDATGPDGRRQGGWPRYRVSFLGQPVVWHAANFFGRNFEVEAQHCVPFYETPTYALSIPLPDMSVAVITGVSYEFDQDLLVGEIVQIEMLRNRDQLALWEDDWRINVGPRGQRFAFSWTDLPIELWARYDRGEQVQVRVTVKGVFPFVHLPADVLQKTCRVILRGYVALRTDDRQGAPIANAARHTDSGGSIFVSDDMVHEIEREYERLKGRPWRILAQ